MTIPDRLSFARWRPVPYIAEAGPLKSPRGWILHVVVGNGSPFNTFNYARSPHRRFSHLWVSKRGEVEQYQLLSRVSWAQGGGNSMYWSVETEGFDNERLTQEQLNTLAKIHRALGTVDRIATAVGDYGIGTHAMGGRAWGGHACPGSIRSGQRATIIRLAQAGAKVNDAPKGITSPRGPFPLPEGHHYGMADGTARAHNGAQMRDRQAIMQIQHAVGAEKDGDYGPVTRDMVSAYQKLRSMPVSGTVDKATWGKM